MSYRVIKLFSDGPPDVALWWFDSLSTAEQEVTRLIENGAGNEFIIMQEVVSIRWADPTPASIIRESLL